MVKRLKLISYALALLVTYLLLFYFIVTQQANVDFSSFYAASLAYLHHLNPYQELSSTFLTHPTDLAINLNPPFFLLLFVPLTYFQYTTAALIWAITSLILGVIGSLICFLLTTTPHYFKRNYIIFIMIYLSAYATLMNTNFNQIAGFLLFLIMSGYYLFLQKRDYWAGLVWGLAIAIKLFPALLFIFVLCKKRYKVAICMLLFWILVWIVPFLFRGAELYTFYFQTLDNLVWYGNSWNASVYGFIFRLFVNINTLHNVLTIKIGYQILFIIILSWYAKKLNTLSMENNHHAFCFTLIMMLVMSPFGWMYYFSLLLLPLLVIYQALVDDQNNRTGLWSICLFLLNMPIANVQTRYIEFFVTKITLYSIYFYGLITLIYLFFYAIKINKESPLVRKRSHSLYTMPMELILVLGVFIVLSILLIHVYQTAPR